MPPSNRNGVASTGGATTASPPADAATQSPPPRGDNAAGRLAIGIDIGGSGIKGAIVDVESGELRSERIRLRTPEPSTPERCISAMAEILEQITSEVALDRAAPIGLGIPAVTIDGIVLTATNIHEDWLGFEAASEVGQALGRRTVTVNDA